ncbi:hypothetical protein B5C34_05350 [Pacificimonas flava]|uniref:LexA repressor DNA-binding domain-containing protein n=2 Tax=Pacificimonas TaxID=1960290 RepID=A0A219B597_9SPHN|nr:MULTISPECIES: MarR family transcriptional regulator [Pacificimonas]MBZ6377354.1 MarR family transcriptional regulator [Pacificimonas aurantium]OWV32938.1 hypothetical protein B5C34_05350 [Pacificimonas flava]
MTGAALTPRMADCLFWIDAFQKRHGAAPSYRQIADGLGVASKASVARMIARLEERGFLRRQANQARSVEILGLPARAESRCPHCHRPWDDAR